jgi:hypothetical protein
MSKSFVPTPADVERKQAGNEVRLPNGNLAIKLDTGELLDINYVTLGNVARYGEHVFEQVMAWLTDFRAKAAEKAAEREAEQEAFRQALQQKAEAQRAIDDEHDSRPATLGDLRRARI